MRRYVRIGLKIAQIITQSLLKPKQQAQKRRWFARKDLIFLFILAVLSIAAFLTPYSNTPAPTNKVASIGGSGGVVAEGGAVITPPPLLPTPPPQTTNDAENAANTQAPGNGITNPIARNPLLTFTSPDLTVGQDGVQRLWWIGVAVVDIFLVALFAFHGVRIMVSGAVLRFADAAESIPRVLLALVVAHTSLVIMGMFLGFNNSVSVGLANTAPSLGLNSTSMPTDVTMAGVLADSIRAGMSMSPMLMGPLAIPAHYGINPLNPIGTVIGAGQLAGDLVTGGPEAVITNTINGIWGAMPRLLLKLIGMVLSWAFIAQLFIRILLIDLYIIISAPCIACWALPGQSGQPVTRFWLQGFVTTVMVQILQVGGLIVALVLFDSLLGLLQSDVTDIGFNALLPYILYIAVLWFLLRLPSLLRSSTTQMIQSGGQAVVQAAGAAASTAITAATTAVSAAGVVAIVAR